MEPLPQEQSKDSALSQVGYLAQGRAGYMVGALERALFPALPQPRVV